MNENGTPPADQFAYDRYPEVQRQTEVHYYVRLFLDYRWWIVGFTLAVTLLSALYVFLATPRYSATTTVFIDVGSPAKGAEISNNYSQDSWAMSELFLNAQADIIQSKEVLGEAASSLHLEGYPEFSRVKEPAEALRKMVHVSRKKDSSLFSISAVCRYQNDVAAWANAVADAYSLVSLRQKTKVLQDANALMKRQVQDMEKEYQQLGQQYGEYLSKTGTYFPQNQKTITDSRIQQIELRRNEVLIQKSEVEAKLGQLKAIKTEGRDPMTVVSIKDDPSIQRLEEQYSTAQKDLAQLSTQLTPQHPKIVKKTEEIEAIRRRIREQASVILRASESQASALNTEYADLTKELDTLKLQAAQLTGGSSQGEAMQAGVDAVRNYINLLSQKVQEVDVAATLTNNSIRIVDRAETPKSATYPRKARTILLAFLIGLMVSVGAVLALQLFDTRIKNPDFIEKGLGLTLLATIPTYHSDHKTLIVESFQALRTSLMYLSDQKAKNVLMITSPAASEGKSTVASNLGITLASSGDRVLLIDCDARKASVHKFFQLQNKNGIADYLASTDEDPAPFVQGSGKPNLSLFLAGETPVNPPMLYTMEKFKRLIQWARKNFTWVIIDTPPVIAVTDATIIANEVDLCFLVVQFLSTTRPLIEQSVGQLERIGRPIAGVVMNQFAWNQDYYYKHYYYRHYAYYHKQGKPPQTGWGKTVAFTKRLLSPRKPAGTARSRVRIQ